MIRTDLQHFVIGGAPKCGTTTLANVFARNPSVAMANPKEPNFFVSQIGFRDGGDFRAAAENGTFCRGENYYFSLFSFNARHHAYGDASTAYIHCEETPQLLKSLSPDARIIFLVREPVSRIYSHYLHDIRKSGVQLPTFADLVQANTDTFRRYVWNSLYATHLERFLTEFRPEQIRIVDYEHLFADFGDVITDLSAFIGVEPNVDELARAPHDNSAARPRSFWLAALMFQISRSGIGDRLPLLRAKPLRDLKKGIVRRNLMPIRNDGPDPASRMEIRSQLANEMRRFIELQRREPGMFIAKEGFAESWLEM